MDSKVEKNVFEMSVCKGKESEIYSNEFLSKCGEVFLQQRQQEEVFVVICSVCDKRLMHLDAFKAHIAEHIDEADEEDEGTDSQPEFETNFISVAEERFEEELVADEDVLQPKCEYLELDDAGHDTDTVEYDAVNDEGGIQTDSCATNMFTSDSSVSSERTKPAADTPSKCKHCSQQFHTAEEVEWHVCPKRPNGTTNIFKCAKCGKCFGRKSILQTHEYTHALNKPHVCHMCDAAFAAKQNLAVHIRRHLGEKPFPCSHCSKAFHSSTERKAHERSHTGVRPFLCEQCGKAHTTASRLHAHRQLHHNASGRVIECEQCGKRFSRRCGLQDHIMLVHMDVPRCHCCTQCTAAFKTSSDLKQHCKIHAKQKQYKCKICGKEFAQNPGLYAHMKSHRVCSKPRTAEEHRSKGEL